MLFSPFAIPIVAILATFGYLAVHAIAQAVCKAKMHRVDAELKMALADRGMSAAEIERVVTAKSKGGGKRCSPTAARYTTARTTPTSPLPPHKPTAPSGL